MTGSDITFELFGGIYLVFALGLIVSHYYRYAIIKLGWLKKDIISLIPRVILACLGLAVGFHSVYLTIGNFAFGWGFQFSWTDPNLITWAMLFFIWNLIYFSYIFFQRFRNEELKNAQLEATRNEYELRRLKDQMNPHFIFNAMNTIRALIDEDPVKAKNAVTQLSNVLRSSLSTGKHELISLEKEIVIVKDYLEIEKARYEERLMVKWRIEERSLKSMIPPLMLQTIVENCIKHGINQLPDGGTIEINSRVVNSIVEIEVLNPGRFDPDKKSEASLGIQNTKNRLSLSFGDHASITYKNTRDNRVRTLVVIPLNTNSL